MKDGAYPEDPNVTRKITATFSLSTGDVFFPTVLIADVVGDSLADLDRDGKKDIIIRHQAPSRVVLATGRTDPSPR